MFLNFLYGPDKGHNGGGEADPTTPPPASSPPSSPPGGFDSTVYNAQGQMWKDLYHGTQGGIASLRSQHTQALAEIQAQLDANATLLQEKDAAIAQQQAAQAEQATNIATLTEQAQTIPDLNQRAAYADKLEIFLQFPTLVAAQVSQDVPGEEGAEPTQVVVNPYLQMIATTSLAGDELRTHLSQLTSAIPAPAAQTSAPTSAPPMPPQPTPVEGGTKGALDELREALRLDPANPALKDKYLEVLEMLAGERGG